MNHKYRQNFIRAGALAREARAYGRSLIVQGASYHEVIGKIRQKICELGARPAFPPQIALNHVAAHYLPPPDEGLIFTDQVVKLDVGVCYEGAIGDCAVTVDLSGRHQKLIDAAEAALMQAEQSLRVGQPVREIGKIIADTISAHGFKPIQNLSGHGLGEYKIHMPPQIPNCETAATALIRPNMTFAIEPFATTGAGLVYEEGPAAIFAEGRARPLHTAATRELWAHIRSFRGLPFALQDLITAKRPLAQVKAVLNELLASEMVVGYAPLVEAAHGIVAQAENSVYVDQKGQILITTR